MKISKLFHWLYAILMLLPVMFIGGRCLYVVFNKNAKDNYSGDTWTDVQPVYYESNEVNTINDLVLNNIYYYSNNLVSSPLPGFFAIELETSLIANQFGEYSQYNMTNAFFYGESGNTTMGIRLHFSDYNTRFLDVSSRPLYFIPIGFTTIHNITQDIVNKFEYTDFKYVKEYIEVPQQETLDNAFLYSVSQLNEVPLFSWAKTSFLVQPFCYVTGLFGIGSDNPINTLLSYWLSISIIWLVFDLVMYVPLLIHRWLDKGVLE